MKNFDNSIINKKTIKKTKNNNADEDSNSINEINYHKLQIENVKKESEINKLREEIQQYKKAGFDPSSSFPWPNEFKNRWISLTHTMIMDCFETINSNYIILMRTINILVQSIYDISKNQIRQKAIELLKCLGMKNISDINISNFYNKFQRLLFQDFFKTLFIVSNEFYNSIISKIKKDIMNNQNLFNKKEIDDIFNDLNNANIIKFIREVYFLCLYMNLNEPKLAIKTSTEINYRYYNKNEYDIIEGFAKNNDICIIILNSPMIGLNKPFKGIKPAVFIIENPTKEIIDICQKQKNNIFYNNIIEISKEESKKYINNNNGDKNKKNKNLNNKNNQNSSNNSNDLLNINNNNFKSIPSDIKEICPKSFMTIDYKNNNKKKEELFQQKNFSKTINRENIIKMKYSPDYVIKKHIINPTNIQKLKKGEDKEKIGQKNLKEKLKNIHFINPQKILNINQIKQNTNKKKKLLNEIERNNSIESNDKKYTYTEANINMSTPLSYSLIDTANNMINLLEMKKKLGYIFFSKNKSHSPCLKDKININKVKKPIKPRRIAYILNQIITEKNNKKEEIYNNKNMNIHNNYLNDNNTLNELDQEKILSLIKKREDELNSSKKGNNVILESIKNNFKEALNYNENINNIINSELLKKYLNTNNNEHELINDKTKNKYFQKTNYNLKNFKNEFNLNDSLKNSNNDNVYKQDKFSLKRKINNSISISRQKNMNNKNININSINSTSNNNNININININNNNNTNDNNFRGNVILNYENNESKIAKTEPNISVKRKEKSFQKINANKYINKIKYKNINIKKNIDMRMNTMKSNNKKLIKNKKIFEESSKNNNTISYKTNLALKQINDNYINQTSSNYFINNSLNEKILFKKEKNNIKNKNPYFNNLNMNKDKIVKNNNYNHYNKSGKNYIKEKINNSKNNLNSNKNNKKDNLSKLKSISYDPFFKTQYYSLEKSQDKKIYSNYNNSIINNKYFSNIKEKQIKKINNLNKRQSSIKKYNKNNKKQNIIYKNFDINEDKKKYTYNTQNSNSRIKNEFQEVRTDLNSEL